MENYYKCSSCTKSYSSQKSLYTHIRYKHTAGETGRIKCALCSYSTHRSDYLKRHERLVHQTQRERKVLCALCEFSCYRRKDMLQHYSSMHHDLTIREEKHEFCNENEFYQWKHRTEKDTVSEFVLARGEWTKSTDKSRNLSFRCHRDGHYKPSGNNLHRLKVLGSNKISGYCPARMDVTISSSGEVKVTFCSTHVGHQPEIGRLRLSKSEREEIAKKIAMKIPFDYILDYFRCVSQDNGLQRRNFLSRKDIHNIAHSYNLKCEVRHSNDCFSVESWVKEMVETSSVVQFYKAQGVVSEEYDLEKEDFILIIMNETQKDMLDKFGSNCVCMYSIHGLNEYGFELTTLLVLDELWQGFPCSFMFSNRRDLQVLEVFLRVIQNSLQEPLKSNVFMSDMSDEFFSAWCKIMCPPKHRVFCSWHVDKAWRENLCKVKGHENQIRVYKLIRSLMEHKDKESFQDILEEAVLYMKTDPDLSEFGMYFEKTYKPTSENWAYCYQQHNGLNTNMQLERMHNVIEHIYLQGKKPNRLETVIRTLMCYLRDKLSDRLLRLNGGKLTSKISAIKQRHESSKGLKPENVLCGDGEWTLTIPNVKETYIVKKLAGSSCNCELRCCDCKVCIHEYICSCIDSTIRFNMCKHIHLICRFTAGTVVSESESSDNELFTCELVSDENQHIIIKELPDPGTSRQDRTLEKRREQLLEQFNLCLNEAKSEEACEVIGRCLSTLTPILRAMKSPSSSPALSSNNVSKCEPQRRCVTTERKLEVMRLSSLTAQKDKTLLLKCVAPPR